MCSGANLQLCTISIGDHQVSHFMPSDSESSQVTGGSELFAPSMPFWNSSREQGGVSGLFAVTGDFIYRFDLAVDECQFQMGNRETALSSIRFCDPLLRIQLTLRYKLYLSITAVDSVAHWLPLVSNSYSLSFQCSLSPLLAFFPIHPTSRRDTSHCHLR